LLSEVKCKALILV